jgi:hypothetical protein
VLQFFFHSGWELLDASPKRLMTCFSLLMDKRYKQTCFSSLGQFHHRVSR